MTRALEVAREAVASTSLRTVAKAVGISHEAMRNYIDDPDASAEKTRNKVERWAAGQPVAKTSEAERAELGQELARINALDIEEWRRMLLIDAVSAAFRAEAMRDAERARLEAEIAATERARAVGHAETAAGERARAVTPAPSAPITDAPSKKKPKGGERRAS